MIKRRIFIAINLPENIKNKLIDYQRKWADLPVRWAPKINLHISLIFIGYVDNDQMYDICNIAKKVAKQHEPFNINLKRIVLGPPNKPPRMFWIEGGISKEVSKLKDDLENSLLESKNSGFRKKEMRAYSPHITLGRIKQEQWRELDSRPEINEEFEHRFPVETIEVMQSNLKRTGAEYSVLEVVNLGL